MPTGCCYGPWVQADLIGLGLKKLDPSAFKSADYAHMSTSQLQHLLLKVDPAPPSSYGRWRAAGISTFLIWQVALVLGV